MGRFFIANEYIGQAVSGVLGTLVAVVSSSIVIGRVLLAAAVFQAYE